MQIKNGAVTEGGFPLFLLQPFCIAQVSDSPINQSIALSEYHFISKPCRFSLLAGFLSSFFREYNSRHKNRYASRTAAVFSAANFFSSAAKSAKLMDRNPATKSF